MPTHRSYRLLCPIARALDKLGDRWSLLILRDLHAGPARFSDLFAGLDGIASNLLTTRLLRLREDGLIVKRPGAHGAVVYELTENGELTAPLLFELAAFGSRQSPPANVRRPGNLRTVVVTLKEALRRVVEDETARVDLIVDDEHFSIDIKDGRVSVRYEAYPDAPTAVATNYDALVAAADRSIELSDFAKNHVQVQRGTTKTASAFLTLMARAFSA